MFKDYYEILNISQDASFAEMKASYRTLSKKWHPDLNPNMDTVSIMQDINESYSILRDINLRSKYDIEFNQFEQQRYSESINRNDCGGNIYSYEYSVQDDELNYEINKARSNAKKIVEEFFKTLKQTSEIATKGAWQSRKDIYLD